MHSSKLETIDRLHARSDMKQKRALDKTEASLWNKTVINNTLKLKILQMDLVLVEGAADLASDHNPW